MGSRDVAAEPRSSARLVRDLSHDLNLNTKTFVEYVWLGGSGNASDIRSQTRILPTPPESVESLAHLSMLGGRAGLSTEESPSVVLRPRVLFADPFRGAHHSMVLCDACLPEQIDASGASLFPAQPHDQNNRAACLEMVSRAHSRRPWVTFVQELTLIDPSSEWPLGWSSKGLPLTAQLQGLLVGTRSAPQGRDVAELHARFCVHAGVKITKFGPRDVPGVWYFQDAEPQIGPAEAMEAADHLWMARFVMGRVADLFHVIVSWDPKPVQGDWAGCGCSVGFSTAETRVPGNGWGEIERQLGRLVQPDKHRMHMQAYGIGLERRTGAAAIMMPQSWSVGESPGSSLHVPLSTARKRCGYFVDSRPGASVDPYIAVLLLLSTALEIPLPERASAEQDGSALHAAGGQNVSVGSPILRRFGAMGPGSNQGGSHHGAGGSYHSAHTQQMVGAVHGLARGGSGAGTSFHEQLAWMTMGAVGHGRGDGGSMHGGASGRHGSHGRRISSRAERDRGPNLTGSVPEDMVLGPSEPWAHGHDMEGSSHKRHRTALPPGWGDPVLYQWQPPWHQEEAKGGGKKEGGGEGQGEEMSENSPDSIADMMAGDKDGDSDSDGGGESDRKGRDAKAGSGRGR